MGPTFVAYIGLNDFDKLRNVYVYYQLSQKHCQHISNVIDSRWNLAVIAN